MLTTIKNKFVSLLQLILVMIFIIFEELIWEGIAKPIYETIHSLKILQKIEVKLQHINAYVILVVFVMLLATVEAFGIYAGMLFVSGQMLLGLALYISKIPIAAFTFWLFRVTEEKLMQFTWFQWIYEKMMAGIAWLKSQQIYVETMVRLRHIKEQLKKSVKVFKAKYFAKESPFVRSVKRLYKTIKASLKK
ncbi:Bll5565 protein [hydrothermal vent metagenome]|uniref:Bll5565 protein n=1 Tax=hydrothermal vent metagenome TaxID=652676 RepID=A0A1W1CHX6_9ZZZZ